MPATKAAEIIKETLNEFGLDAEHDIVGLVTDGASVMIKTGKILGKQIFHQLCHAHGYHLTVGDVLYNKKNEATDDDTRSDEENVVFDNDDEENESFDNDDEDGELWEFENEPNPDAEVNFSVNIDSVIKKVQHLVNVFRRSPIKSDCLKKICMKLFGKEMSLIKDIKIRWNSLLDMLRRFLVLKAAILEALKELSLLNLFPNE